MKNLLNVQSEGGIKNLNWIDENGTTDADWQHLNGNW